MRTLFIILTLLLSAVPSRAVIPLELVAEIQLPDSTVDWDVQHWMDDSTFGWVAATKDSVIYSTNGTTTNAADFDYENPEAPAWRFVNVRIIKMPELLDHVTFFSIMKDSSFRGYSFYRWAVMFDLEADTLLRSWGPWEDENNDNSESLVSLSAVPDLPSATRFVTWNGSLE